MPSQRVSTLILHVPTCFVPVSSNSFFQDTTAVQKLLYVSEILDFSPKLSTLVWATRSRGHRKFQLRFNFQNTQAYPKRDYRLRDQLVKQRQIVVELWDSYWTRCVARWWQPVSSLYLSTMLVISICKKLRGIKIIKNRRYDRTKTTKAPYCAFSNLIATAKQEKNACVRAYYPSREKKRHAPFSHKSVFGLSPLKSEIGAPCQHTPVMYTTALNVAMCN